MNPIDIIQLYPGTTAVCGKCGEVYVKAKGHNCPRK